ncbi:MAG TPA: uroporphyrinogen-III C-methyltransferase [Gemmataceae bacterium]|jgi:uroporphyrinogen III methyltransferase/synthase|nr:uroporphyrinogen-III C-methyltransferase [Gemmataceae bacterium]
MAEHAPRVFLVGAGPGNPGLITLRAVECLAQADVVIYDRLVPACLLEHVPAHAECICVSQLPGAHAERYPQVQAKLLEAARQGKCVVRLKGGDPLLFGRGAEEAETLREVGIPYEIVPGVTAALAAAAYAGIPLTHRQHASAVAFVTGHEDPDKPGNAVDWRALAHFPGTLVVYMGITRLPQIVQRLLDNGKDARTPAAAIHWGATGNQHTLSASLVDLTDRVREADLRSPAIVVIGPVAALRARLSWVEQRPLFGKRILVTRPRAQAGEMVHKLELLGAAAHALSVIEIREPADWSPVDEALQRIAQFHWLVFTSANGVHAFVRRLRQQGLDLRALGALKLAVIGPGTAEALRGYHLEADLVPPEFRSESLAAALAPAVRGKHVLLARADRGREVLREELKDVAEVEQVAVYSQIDVDFRDAPAFRALSEGEIDFITLTSSNIARAFLKGIDEQTRARIKAAQIQLVSISPVTSAAIREFDVPVATEATSYTTAGIVEALLKLAERQGP